MTRDRSDPKGFGLGAAAFAFIAVALAMGALITAGQAWSRANDAKKHGGSGSAAAAFNAKDQTLDPNATPPKAWTAKDPTLAPAPSGTVHDVEFRVQEKVMDAAPGVTQLMWSFNGQVPGPVLHGRVGDTFNVKLVNDGKMGHSVDFHASQTSMTNDMRTLSPGQSLTYSFKADYSGIWMYHCGTAPVLDHIGNGMYGAVVIDPPNLPPVQHEWVFVQSEQYYGPKNQPGDLAKMEAFMPDAVVFNGYPFQYMFSPLTVNVGDRIRAWVIDDGPSENSSFHIIGTIFDSVFKEGAYLLQSGNAESGGSQALDLQPAQGGFVELQVRKPGQYAMVTHKFQNPGRGALGMIMAK